MNARSKPKYLVAGVLAVLVLVGAGLFVYTQVPAPSAPTHHPGQARSAAPAKKSPASKRLVVPKNVVKPPALHPFVPPAKTLLATTDHTIPKSAAPGKPTDGSVPGSWHGGVSTLPVIARRPGWVDVRLAQRPNESTAWVLARDVKFSVTPYAIVIDLATTHLFLYRDGKRILSAPVGVGTPQYPTPTGTFFTAFFAAPPSPAYGAFVMVTSGHSNVITDWEMSGDAMVAIHGPLGSDAEIGTTGARISHGCIRMHENDLLRLRDVPVGTPIYIFSSWPEVRS